jgi:hypothetical protein
LILRVVVGGGVAVVVAVAELKGKWANTIKNFQSLKNKEIYNRLTIF